jgi:hypothetical protein
MSSSKVVRLLILDPLDEDLNTPPRIYATDLRTRRNALLLDLNPQFAELNLGEVESLTWNGTQAYDSSPSSMHIFGMLASVKPMRI